MDATKKESILRNGNQMVDQQKAMTDAIDAICRLNWGQLLLLNNHLSEHIHNIWQDQLLRKAREEELAKQKEKLS
jgi:hypothetical protein